MDKNDLPASVVLRVKELHDKFVADLTTTLKATERNIRLDEDMEELKKGEVLKGHKKVHVEAGAR